MKDMFLFVPLFAVEFVSNAFAHESSHTHTHTHTHTHVA
jgi:hypothetical protein